MHSTSDKAEAKTVGQPARTLSRVVFTPITFAWLGLFLSLVYLYLQISGADPRTIDGIWLTSDTLYPVNVFTDIFMDGYPLSGWMFSIAPCWFPDLLATGLFLGLTRNVVLATLLAGFIQVGLFVGAFQLFRRAIGISGSRVQDTFMLAAGVGIALFVATDPGVRYPGLYQFFLPQTHVGSLLAVLYALGLGMLVVRRKHEETAISRFVLIVYAVLCVLAGMSNLLFFVQMLLPLTASLIVAVFFGMLTLRTCLIPVLIGWPAAIFGAILNRVLFNTTDVGAQAGISAERILGSLDVFMRGAVGKLVAADPLHMLAVVWAAVCVVFVLSTIRTAAIDGSQHLTLSSRMSMIFFLSCLLSSIGSAAAIILGGSNGLYVFKDYVWSIHYLHPTFLLPLFGVPFVVSWGLSSIHPHIAAKVSMGIAVVIVVAPAFSLAMGSQPKVLLHEYRPPLVQFVDDLAVEEGLKYGVAGYWQARIITLLSTRGVRAYAVDANMAPFLWVSNKQWYQEAFSREKQPAVDFVVLDDPLWKIDRNRTVALLGEPSRDVRFQDTRILVYSDGEASRPVHRGQNMELVINRGLNERLQFFQQGITSPTKKLTLQRDERIEIPVQIENPGTETWMSIGRHPVNVSYRWFSQGEMLPLEGERTELPSPIRPKGSLTLPVTVVAPVRKGNFRLRISLVQEGIDWFMERGNSYLEIPASVR